MSGVVLLIGTSLCRWHARDQRRTAWVQSHTAGLSHGWQGWSHIRLEDSSVLFGWFRALLGSWSTLLPSPSWRVYSSPVCTCSREKNVSGNSKGSPGVAGSRAPTRSSGHSLSHVSFLLPSLCWLESSADPLHVARQMSQGSPNSVFLLTWHLREKDALSR